MKTTNVRPEDLNYDQKPQGYDEEIVVAIPYHGEIQRLVAETAHNQFGCGSGIRVLDLGVGSGLTTEAVRKLLHYAQFTVIDFSANMLKLARRKLGEKGVQYICADYSKMKFSKKYDLIVSVINLHHQTNRGKRLMIRKIYQSLNPGGIFLLGDLVTYEDEKDRALNNARHFHHLVENAPNEETLRDWAHHHMCLNQPATIPQHISWMYQAGFYRTEVLFTKFNTALMLAVK